MAPGVAERRTHTYIRHGTTEVNVGRGDVSEALMNALMVIVLDKGLDLGLECAGEVVAQTMVV